jgi:hypothetical protein
MVGEQPVPGADCHVVPRHSGPVVGQEHRGRRASRPFGHAGHRQDDLSRQTTSGGRRPGHVPPDNHDAERARCQDRARLFVLRGLVCLRPVRRQDRPVLGAVAGCRVPQPGAGQAATRCDRGAWPRRHGRGLGLRIRPRR